MDIENPMVLDSVWPDYDEIDRQTREEIEAQKADDEQAGTLHEMDKWMRRQARWLKTEGEELWQN